VTTQIVAIGFVFLLVAVLVGVGWWQSYDNGSDDAKAKELKRRADAADQAARELARETPIPSRYRRMLRRMRDAGKR
jgi:hypothetical protein